MKIKILHIVDSLNVGGLENGLVNLINNSTETFQHVICCLRQNGPMADRIVRPQVTIHDMRITTPDYFVSLKLRAIIKSESPDIVHTRNWGTVDGILGAKLASIKNIIHGEHGRDHDDIAGTNGKRIFFRKLIANHIRQFVTVSADLKHWLVDTVGIEPDQVMTIINGVDTEKFSPANASRNRFKSTLGCDDQVLLVGSVGRLDKMKNYPLFIKAMTELKKNGQNCQGIIVGDGPERGALEMMIAENDAPVALLGKQDNVAEYLRAFDIFVLPSLNEGVSNTILEAMACGLPVCATRVGGNPELIQDKISGYLVESGDVCGLAGALQILSDDAEMRVAMGTEARQRCCDEFSLKRMVRDYEDLYLKFASQESRGRI